MDESASPIPIAGTELQTTEYRLLRSEAEAVGRIISAGSELEHVLTIALFNVVGLDPIDGYILFGRDTISTRLNKLKAALMHKKEMLLLKEEFCNLVKSIKEVIELRNMLAHGV